MSKLVIATGNQGKVREIKAILDGFYDEICSLKDEGIKIEVVEDGNSFYENAKKKAEEISKVCDCDVLADDSGLCVDALDGAPGIYSARFAGESATDDENNEKLMQLIKDVPEDKRGGYYACSMVMARGGKEFLNTYGEVAGVIQDHLTGSGGFGYDPLFFLPEYGKTFGEIEPEIKNQISHRSKALEALKKAFDK